MSNDMYNSDLITKTLIRKFLSRYDSFEIIKASRNTVVDIKQGPKSFILKAVRLNSSHGQNLANEANWIDYLSQNGISVPSLVRSASGKLVEQLDNGDNSVIGYCYEKIPVKSNLRYWLEASFIQELGRTIGKMHLLARRYSSSKQAGYLSWDSDDYLKNANKLLHPSQSRVAEAISKLKMQLSSLDKSRSTFGLIHDDLHSGNVFKTGKSVAILDFECLHKSWFVADISSALLFRVWIGPDKDKPESKEKATHFLGNLLIGYKKACDLEKEWYLQVPLFLRLREIRLYTSMFSGMDVQNNHDNPLFHHVYRSITEDRPFLDLDYGNIL